MARSSSDRITCIDNVMYGENPQTQQQWCVAKQDKTRCRYGVLTDWKNWNENSEQPAMGDSKIDRNS